MLVAYTASLLLRAFILVFNMAFSECFECNTYDDVKIITSDYPLGQVVLVIVEINQLIPHLVIPIALYVIPIKSNRSSTEVFLQDTLLEEDDEEQTSHSDTAIQRRISRSILTRSITSPKIS